MDYNVFRLKIRADQNECSTKLLGILCGSNRGLPTVELVGVYNFQPATSVAVETFRRKVHLFELLLA